MKRRIFKKLMVLCTSAALAFGTVPAGAADVVPQAVTVETVSAQAAKPGKNLKDKALAKLLDKVIKDLKFTKKTTDKQKLQKLFNYTKGCRYTRYMGIPSAKGWDAKLAKETLSTKKASCYHAAATFAYLARRATGLPVRICIGTSNLYNTSRWQNHGWVEIKVKGKWYTFDANAGGYSKRKDVKWFMQKHASMEGKVYKTQKIYNVNF